MFNSSILDVVIGMVVMYLQLSLVCTAFNELIASWFKKRAKELEKGIRGLLTSQELVDKFYDHPLIRGLRPDGRKPSYIPSRTFSMALMDIVRSSFDAVKTTTNFVAAKTVALDNAQVAVDAADKALTDAHAMCEAVDAALAAAGVADRPTRIIDKQEADNKLTAAEAAKKDADAKLTAAQGALDEAKAYKDKLQAELDAAQRADAAAKEAETRAETATDADKESLKQAAVTARTEANKTREQAQTTAAELAPSAASLLNEARDKVVGAQSDLVPPELKTALLALMDNAGTNLNKAQANLEQWFDDAMDRVSGVYKRKSQIWVVVIAVLVTVFANVDSLQVADSLSQDKALRESLVAAAPELAQADKDLVDKERGITQPTQTPTPPLSLSKPTAGGVGSGKGGTNSIPSTTPTPTPTPALTPASTPSPTPPPAPALSNIKASLDQIKKLGVPIGYIRVCTPSEEKLVENKCPNKVDAALIDADVTLKRAQDDLDKANTALQNADGDKTIREAAQKLALAQVAAAKVAQDQAIKAAATAKLVEAEAVTAEASAQSDEADAKLAQADAQANSQDKAKQDLATAAESKAKQSRTKAEEARRKADNQKEMLRVECPKCRKESELSPSELKQRLPTTHGYELVSQDFGRAVTALFWDSWDLLYSHWLGWLLTALAISLGAPFWFDTLNRVMVIRSTVKPHEKSQEQESKDNPDDEKGKKT